MGFKFVGERCKLGIKNGLKSLNVRDNYYYYISFFVGCAVCGGCQGADSGPV